MLYKTYSYNTHKQRDVCTCTDHMLRGTFSQITCVTTTELMSSVLSHYKSFKLTFNTSHPTTASLNTQRVAQVTDQQPSNLQCFCFRVFHSTSTMLSAPVLPPNCSVVCLCREAAARKQLVTLLASRSGLEENT